MSKPTRDAHLLSGAYVLDALTQPEVDDMEAAMASSEDLRSEVAELTDTAVLLGLAVAPAEPPEALRGRLLDLVGVTPQLPPQVAQEADEPVEQPHPVESVRRPGHVVQGPRHWFQRPSSVLAAAAAVLLLLGGGVLVGRAVEPAPTSSSASEFASLTSAPDVRHAQRPIAGGGTATVYSSAQQGRSAVVLTGERAAPSGKVLELWRVDGSKITSAGLYQPTDGHTYTMLEGGSLASSERVAITLEPAGGSKQPTTTPVVTVPVT